MAPAVITRPPDGQRELHMMRWGFPPYSIKGPPRITNVRHTGSSWWKPYLRPEFRCLVPVTSFCEYDWRTGNSVPTWFAIDESRPLFFFAGIWRSWRGVRGPQADPVESNHMLFSFLTTDANDTVRPVHEKAMPVLLLDEQARETWMNAPMEEALLLQKPAANDAVRIVSVGPREDGAP